VVLWAGVTLRAKAAAALAAFPKPGSAHEQVSMYTPTHTNTYTALPCSWTDAPLLQLLVATTGNGFAVPLMLSAQNGRTQMSGDQPVDFACAYQGGTRVVNTGGTDATPGVWCRRKHGSRF
jgi:hypothetical protein